MLSLATGGYTAQQVKDVLHYKKGRHISFRYELLDANDIFKSHITEAAPAGEVRMDADAQIKRTGRFVFRYDGFINWETDKIKPYFMLHMPDGGVCEWPLGVFFMPTPGKQRSAGRLWYEVEAYDKTVILGKDSDSGRTFFEEGTAYTDAVAALLTGTGIATAIITQSEHVLATDREWELGTPKAEIIKTLLTEINYSDIHTDANGFFIVEPYAQYDNRVAGYVYAADQYSIIVEDTTVVQLDSFDVPNVIIGVVSNPDVGELLYVVENTDPGSPISIPSRNGRRVVEKVKFDGIASEEELAAATRKYAASKVEVYETVTFNTALMPHHEYDDLLMLENAATAGRYLETGWSMMLQAGAQMRHTARRLMI